MKQNGPTGEVNAQLGRVPICRIIKSFEKRGKWCVFYFQIDELFQDEHLSPSICTRWCDNLSSHRDNVCPCPTMQLYFHMPMCEYWGYFTTLSGISTTRTSPLSLVLYTKPILWSRDSWLHSGHLPFSFWSWRRLLPANDLSIEQISLDHQWIWPPQRSLFEGKLIDISQQTCVT